MQLLNINIFWQLAIPHLAVVPRDKPRGIFDHKEFCLFVIRSLTPQQAAENALAIAVQQL